MLRSVLREDNNLRVCLKRCPHCGILFLTHPRNARRNDIGCPFGCRQATRKEKSKKRSAEYYRNPEGKRKKQALNARRNGRGKKSMIVDCVDKSTIMHVQMVTGLIEERPVALEEIYQMLDYVLRQHSIDNIKKRRYQCKYWEKIPP